MKNLKRIVGSRTAFLLLGTIIGAVIFGGGIAIASNRDTTMNISYRDVKIVVDGASITPKDAAGTVVEPFISDGTTYLPVRAVSEALGKEVTWDGNSHTVYIGEVPEKTDVYASVADRITVTHNAGVLYEIEVSGETVPGKLANGKDITDDNILAMLAELEAVFPDGTSWIGAGGNGTYYHYNSHVTGPGGGCHSWAGMTADLIWGKGAEYTTHNDMSKVKIGDVVYLHNSTTLSEHWVFVIGTSEYEDGTQIFHTCEGNIGGKVSWNATRYFIGTEKNYPDSKIYSFG